jgi:hypothetical protein
MAYILEINEWNLVTKTNPKPIENQLKTNNEMKCQKIHLRIRLRK